jgi:hypothetical protein
MIISRFQIKSDFLAPAPFFKMARLSNCLFQNHLVLVGARGRALGQWWMTTRRSARQWSKNRPHSPSISDKRQITDKYESVHSL